MASSKTFKLTSFQIILSGFLAIILLGAVLLMLPISTKDGHGASFSDALFTSTSATCVTGLVVRDTATYWSFFGKFVILLLIQIGGLGVVTMAILLAMVTGRKVTLFQRGLLRDTISTDRVGGVLKLTRFIFLAVIAIELLGAVVLLPVFLNGSGVFKGIGMALFHSISAFCNAGFDLMGTSTGAFSSFTALGGNLLLNLAIMLLIVVGGIGFRTWDDVRTNKWRLHKYRLQSKIIIMTTFLLILLPAIYFFFGEFSGLPGEQRVLSSLFQSVTTRTAGFNTVDQAALSDTGLLLTIALMLIGGAPGSTAGGMKVTTIAILVLSAFSVFRRREDVSVHNRRISAYVVKSAAVIFMLYIVLFVVAAAAISKIESLPILSCLFETASAIGTVGLTVGITPALGGVSRAILIFLMFFGRVGGLTMIFAALPGGGKESGRFPLEHISVG